MNKTQAIAEVKRIQALGYNLSIEQVMSPDYVMTDYMTTKGAGSGDGSGNKKVYTGPSLYKPVEGKTTHPFTLTSVQFIPSANAEFAGDPLKGSVLLYALGRKTPIGLIPMIMFVSKCVGTGVKRDHVLAVSQYIIESKCGVQYAEVGDVLSNGTVVDDTHEDYYITYFDVRFSSQFKNANANIAGGLAMSVSSAYDDINPFDID